MQRSIAVTTPLRRHSFFTSCPVDPFDGDDGDGAADTSAVLLECVKVTAFNPFTGKSRDIVAFFDPGSSLTYVSTRLALDLDLPRLHRRRISVNTFASNVPTVIDGFTTELVLRSMRGTYTRLNITASDCIVPSLRTALVEDYELPALRKNECTLITSRVTPDILIGQERIQLFMRQIGPRLPNGFDVIYSILGPMIGGAGKVANATSKVVSSSTVAGTSWTTGFHCHESQEHLSSVSDGILPVLQAPPPPSNHPPSTATVTASTALSDSAPCHTGGHDDDTGASSCPHKSTRIRYFRCV